MIQMTNIEDPSNGSDRPPANSPVMLALLCAALVGLATAVMFLVR